MTQNIYAFDAYGTLFDVHAAVREHEAVLGENAAQISQLWRAKQLEYSWIHSMNKSYIDFWELTTRAFDYAVQYLAPDQRITDQQRQQILDSYWEIESYPEVTDVLGELKRADAMLVILSNGSNDMLYTAVTSSNLTALVDDCLSADLVQTYKTNPKIYNMVTEKFDVAPRDIIFCSSNRWDIAGAKLFGFETVWVNRNNMPDEYPELAPDRTVSDLTALLD